MDKIDIYRNGSLLVTIKPDDNSTQSKAVMGDNKLQLSFTLNNYAPILVGDYCTVFGEVYKVNILPVVEKNSGFNYEYTLTIDSENQDLAQAEFLFLGADNSLREPDFDLRGTASDFIDLILQNAARQGLGWTKGQVIQTDYQTLTFSAENCYNALAKIAEAFETEFWIIGKTIHLTKIQRDTGLLLRQGRNKGLYNLERLPLANSSLITRLYAYGAAKNLPPDYRSYSNRLLIPVYQSGMITNLNIVVTPIGGGTSDFYFTYTGPGGGATGVRIAYKLTGSINAWQYALAPLDNITLTLPTGTYDFIFRTVGGTYDGYDTPFITVGATTPLLLFSAFPQYTERNVDKYGVREAVYIFDDIYPRRTGTITSVDATNIYKFVDSDIDFNVNAQILPGLAPKITFNTGQLSGYTFNISAFNNTTKEFTILKNSDETALDIPNSLIKPVIGDKYVLVDIEMPGSYVAAAEAELLTKAQQLLAEVSEPQVSYNLELDPVYMRRNNLSLGIGDMVSVSDNELSVNRKIRVTATTRNIVNEWDVKVELADAITASQIATAINTGNINTQTLTTVQQQIQNNAVLNRNVIGDLTIQQGTIIVKDLPTTNTESGFAHILVEPTTGKLYRKI